MARSADQLAEIDAELAAFGKSDAELREVVARARALAAALAGDEGLGELLEGTDEAVASARAAARSARPPRPISRRPAPATSTAVGAPAPPPPVDDDVAIGSGLLELPEEELRRANLPPVLELRDEPASDAPGAGDIAGLSVEQLFDDEAATGTEPPSSGALDLADLFADEEPIRLSDPEVDVEALERALPPPPAPPRGRTVPPPVPPGAAAASRRPPTVRPAALAAEDDADETLTGSRAELAGDDDFELLVDDDVLELEDSDEGTDPPPADEPGERKGGLISRILGRK